MEDKLNMGGINKDIIQERRVTGDRRKNRTLPPPKYLISGKRKENRRKTDIQVNYFVDSYSPVLFVLIISIMAMSICDWVFTLVHLYNGAIEINPVMNMFIEIGDGYFFFVKYTMTAIGLLILCLYKNFFPTQKIIVSIFIVYLILTCYHVSCLILFDNKF